jgi:hypothetical protein
MRKCSISIASLLLLAAGCGSSKILTRGNAKDILSKQYGTPAKVRVTIDRQAVIDGGSQGYFGTGGFGLTSDLVLTEKGKNYFDSAGGEVVAGTLIRPFSVTPKALIKSEVISVTGISDGSDGTKIVEFTWTYDFSAVPKEIRDSVLKVAPVFTNEATLRLYDDGWRFVSDKNVK